MIHEIKCRFCGVKTGQIELSDKEWKNKVVNDEILGIVDSRCDQHETEHGNYAKMEQEFKSLGKTQEEFETAIKKADYKKSNLDKEIKKIKDK